MSLSEKIISKLDESWTLMEITESQRIGSHIQKVTLSFNSEAELKFPVGCYILTEVGAEVTRAYSVAEASDSSCTIIVSLSGMGMGARFFAYSPVGQTLKVYGPYSDFPYHYGTKRPKIFMATGTGIAPFVKMIPEAIKENSEIFLALGVAKEGDIPYRSYFDKLAEKYPNFHIVYVISRPDIGWKGARGHITDYFSGEREKLLKKCDVYVCGIPAMTIETLQMLKKSKVPKKQIFVQKFG